MEYTIQEDKEGFTRFIQRLRRKLGDHEHPEDVLDKHPTHELSMTRDHPVLARRRAGQPGRWFHIKLQLPDSRQTSTTLAVRDDNVYVIGFMNQDGNWYELGLDHRSSPVFLLPQEYKAVRVGWGISYGGLTGSEEEEKSWVQELELAGLGRTRDFATWAVSTVSCYHHPPDDVQGQQEEGDVNVILNRRLALAGLILMVKESARFNAFRDGFAAVWDRPDTGTPPFSLKKLMPYNIYTWVNISQDLLRWKNDHYRTWRSSGYRRSMGNNESDALDAVALVYNQGLYTGHGW